MQKNNNQEVIYQLVTTKICVLILGETNHMSWWKSEFLSTTGLSFLSRLYPRSPFAHAVRSTSRAALDLHDSEIGKGNVFHLFRMPNEYEIGMNEYLSEKSKEFASHFSGFLDSKESLINKLSELSGKRSKYKPGPIQIPYEKATFAGNLASAYVWAFEHNEQIFPYFTLENN